MDGPHHLVHDSDGGVFVVLQLLVVSACSYDSARRLAIDMQESNASVSSGREKHGANYVAVSWFVPGPSQSPSVSLVQVRNSRVQLWISRLIMWVGMQVAPMDNKTASTPPIHRHSLWR